MLYKINQKVLHVSKNKVGKIPSFVGGEQKRYYVSHSGNIWSVPEKYLISRPVKSRS